MPISREPSQRALAWVKWNSSKSSLNANKRVTEPEIIHLGGARVGTAFEVLDLPAPDRSKPAERPPTQWAFNPPPPNPPGIGIAIAGPDGGPIEARDNNLNFENERPITQWFPEFQPGVEKNKDDTQTQVTRTAYPYLNTTTTNTAEPELASPSSVGSSSRGSANSLPQAVSPLHSPISPPMDFPDMNLSQTAQFPKRSTSLSQASRYVNPPSAKRIVGDNAVMRAKEIQLRRTQSNAEGARPVEWRGTPPQPYLQEVKEGVQTREVLPQDNDIRVLESQRSARRSPGPSRAAQDPQGLPPLTSAPPNVPLPPISGTKLAGQGKTRDQAQHRRGGSSASERGVERSTPTPIIPIEPQEQADGQQTGGEQKLSSRERLWLHRNYRGEAMFLRAWGLQIASEEDREEGRGILRELMEGEAQEERENIDRQRMLHRSNSQSRSSTATTSSALSRPDAGLDVIAEERHSREFNFHSSADSRGYADGDGERFWKHEHDRRDRRRYGPENHVRNESTDSVLGQYLDLRLNNGN
ncbi:hypothetical protein GGR51DRAFT_269129 [Nemania sp. FL0031]|nr:hypothetical protein GGR51DRAFT_269129 [Nemania sp. FL0031]